MSATSLDIVQLARRERLALAALACGALAIAFAPIFVRLSEIGPLGTAFWRPLLAMPMLWLWLAATPVETPAHRPMTRRDLALFALAGLCFAGDLGFWHFSIALTSVANATLLPNTAPIFVTLVAWLIFRERVTRLFLAGMAVAFAGMAVLMGDSISVSASTLVGDGLSIVTAFFYGCYFLVVERLRRQHGPGRIIFWSSLFTALIMLPALLVAGEPLLATTLSGWLVLLGLAAVSHAGGQGLIAYALAHLPATFVSVGLLLQPVAAAILAWLLLAEALGPLQAIGGVIVLGGVFIARKGRRRPVMATP
ncbi:MAG: DMT family transporter [Alphaproteobacteria bacterium]